MKFAKELEENAIPEWRDKYFDYKGAKKKLKAVGRSVRSVERTSPSLNRRSPFGNAGSVRDAPVYSFLTGADGTRSDAHGQDDNRLQPLRSQSDTRSPQYPKGDNDNERTPRQRPMPVANERSPLRTDERRRDAPDGQPRLARYGSIIGSPPSGNSPLPDLSPQKTQASLLELPDPALTPVDNQNGQSTAPPTDLGPSATLDGHRDLTTPAISELRHPDSTRRQFAHTGNAYEINRPSDESAPTKTQLTRHTSLFLPKRASSVPDTADSGPRPLMQRVLSLTQHTSPASPGRKHRPNDVALENYREADFRQAEFFLFLDKQFDKIENFYKAKEDEATARLGVLREQLHVLRNRRLEEIVAEEQQQRQKQMQQQQDAAKKDSGMQYLENGGGKLAYAPGNPPSDRRRSMAADETANGSAGDPNLHPDPHSHRMASVANQVNNTIHGSRIGKTSKIMGQLSTPPNNIFRLNPANQDYSRRRVKEDVPAYRAAKRKLKTAMQEYYRGLELLKSYALLNRTAFRKINKKYDKTVNAPPGGTMRYMSEKVNGAHFVNSDTIDTYLQTVEDLYARYFERGNRKVAIGKLRGKVLKLGDYTGALCRTGFCLGAGIVLGVQGLVYGILDLFDG